MVPRSEMDSVFRNSETSKEGFARSWRPFGLLNTVDAVYALDRGELNDRVSPVVTVEQLDMWVLEASQLREDRLSYLCQQPALAADRFGEVHARYSRRHEFNADALSIGRSIPVTHTTG